MLIRYFPSSFEPSNFRAPTSPVSSSTVKTASSAGCATSDEAKIDIAIATAIPLSAPSVVSSA